jgi:hypothetical protein
MKFLSPDTSPTCAGSRRENTTTIQRSGNNLPNPCFGLQLPEADLSELRPALQKSRNHLSPAARAITSFTIPAGHARLAVPLPQAPIFTPRSRDVVCFFDHGDSYELYRSDEPFPLFSVEMR